MPSVFSFVCDCGTHLSIMTDSNEGDTTMLLCPGQACKTQHIVRGQVLEAFIVRGGQSIPYDWKGTTG